MTVTVTVKFRMTDLCLVPNLNRKEKTFRIFDHNHFYRVLNAPSFVDGRFYLNRDIN
jgi:hypothetical protein